MSNVIDARDRFRKRRVYLVSLADKGKERVKQYLIFNQADEDQMNEYLTWGDDDAS